MQARSERLTQNLESNICFKVPIYQRTYDWHKQQLDRLFDDIIRIGKDKSGKEHFLGAITYFIDPSSSPTVSQYQIIDGQQRLTTLMLLLRALKHSIDDTQKSVNKGSIDQLLFNINLKDHEHYTLTLGESDDQSFKDILDGGESEESNNITVNFQYLLTKLKSETDYDAIWMGINKLSVVTIGIDQNEDAQAIFESMNSTGLDLSEVDLVKNYVLMPHAIDKQKRIYKSYWRPMEKIFEENDDDFGEFLRQYLTMRHGGIVSKKATYDYFKEYMRNREKEVELKIISKYSEYYANLLMKRDHKSNKIQNVIKHIHDQHTNTAYALLLKILADYDCDKITEMQAVSVFKLVDSYLLRCHVCEMNKGANKVLPEIIPKIDYTNYVESIEKTLMSKIGNRRFPRDVIFTSKLEQLPLYTNRTMCKYMLRRLEQNDNELKVADDVEIEHIMPRTLTKDWKKELGDNHEDIHEKFVHTIGNLTLTGHNQELGNDTFLQKCKQYRTSNLRLTSKLNEYTEWNEKTIEERAKLLINEATKLWPCPKESESREEDIDELENEYLEGKNVSELWFALKKHILNEFKEMKFHMTHVYGAFRFVNQSNDIGIVSLEARKHYIHVTYNIKNSDEVIHQTKFIEDVSNRGHYGVGELRSTLRTEENIKDIIKIISSIYNYKTNQLN